MFIYLKSHINQKIYQADMSIFVMKYVAEKYMYVMIACNIQQKYIIAYNFVYSRKMYRYIVVVKHIVEIHYKGQY